MGIPDEIVMQFRTAALEHLDRVESAWQAVLTSVDDEAAALIHREIHTLKGESSLVGFADVNLVCHKLEDLLELARSRGYAIDEDFDLAVNMALRFLAMLVRKKVGAQLSGIDLPGFVRQIDAILVEARGEVSGRHRVASGTSPIVKANPTRMRIAPALRARLEAVAVDAFIEYAQAQGNRRNRLRTSWHSLRDLIGLQRAVIGPAQLTKHKAGALALARDLGKQIAVSLELETTEVTAEILTAADAALLHLVRNAVDHGIEPVAQRIGAGKSPSGKIAIFSGVRDGAYVLFVTDDGAGIDFGRVHARAVELGLVSSLTGQTFDQERWIEIICHPGLTTRSQVSEVSGRGVGLDAVRTAIIDLGGALTLTSSAGKGTTWTITIPLSTISVKAHVFRAPGLSFPVAIDAAWKLGDGIEAAPVIDLATYGFGSSSESVPDANQVRRAWFTRGDHKIGIVVDELPVLTMVRRLVVTPAAAATELMTLDAIEGLLVRPERLVR